MKESLAIKIEKINTWDDFLREIPNIRKEMENPWFRGQGGTSLELKPSAFRQNHNLSHGEYIFKFKKIYPQIKNVIECIADRCLDIELNEDRENILGILQHLWWPTPLLDWTTDPHVSAYFSFSSVKKEMDRVVIYMFDKYCWENSHKNLTGHDLGIIQSKELERIILRQKAQKGCFTYSFGANVLDELIGDEAESNEEHFIHYCYLPSKGRERALMDLEKMGISHNKLFPAEENIKKADMASLDKYKKMFCEDLNKRCLTSE